MSGKRKKNKKKFSETGLGKFLKGAGSSIVDVVGDVIPGGNILKSLIEGDKILTADQKEMALKHLEMDIAEISAVTARWESDMVSDSWLSKNVRPLMLIYLTLVTSLLIVADSMGWNFNVDAIWIDLLKTLVVSVYLAYFGSRGYEKYQKIRSERE